MNVRVRLEMQDRLREIALLDLGIDSKLRACDLVSLRVRNVHHGDRIAGEAIVLQQTTQRPDQFKIALPTREVVEAWIKQAGLESVIRPRQNRVQIASLSFPTCYSRAGRCGFDDESERARGEAGVEFIRSTPPSFAVLMIQTYKVKYHEPT
jgi:hypothetical protein